MKKYLHYILIIFISIGCSKSIELTTPSSVPNVSQIYISADEAGEIASSFMQTITADTVNSRGISSWAVDGVQLLRRNYSSRAAENDTTFYVVNFFKGGYALVAADRELDNKIYIYSPSGNFNAEDNPVLDIFLENAIATMPDAPRHTEVMINSSKPLKKPYPSNPNTPTTGEVYIDGQWYVIYSYGSHDIKQPLLKTTWHQFAPYNLYCKSNDNKDAPVGCVAVAMGQICSSNRWPERLYTNNYNWDEMLAYSLHQNADDKGADDIAHLLHDIGKLIGIKYGSISSNDTTGSAASIDDAVNGLKKMGYSAEKKTTFYVNDITISLKGNNPVFMSGKSTQSGVGHAWVVDGCDSYTTINEYYNKDTGELYGSYGGYNIYISSFQYRKG